MLTQELVLKPIQDAQELVTTYEQMELAEHPFFQYLSIEPLNLGAIWLLTKNLNAKEAISHNFVRWLAMLIARVDDNRLRSIMAKQLHHELGEGDITQIHNNLLKDLITALEPWRPANFIEEWLEPGRKMGKCVKQLFVSVEPAYVGIGALMVGEICAEQLQLCLGKAIRRQNVIEPSALKWITLHEELEADHADDSLILSGLVPNNNEALTALWQGGNAMYNSITTLLDDLYQIVISIDRS
ncbi:MAG: iron-containing redox enzyme family protein [Crinalium sp.]